jgi:DegV family protein with EDD domain
MMSKIGIAVCGNSGIDYAVHDKRIRVFRSLLIVEEKEYEDFIEINADDFYKTLVERPNIDVHTAQTSTGAILKMYEEMKADGYDEIICISISSHLSGTYQNAVLAAKMMEDTPVHVFDSRTLSAVEAKMAFTALKMSDAGKTVQEILSELEYIRDHHHIFVTVETLHFLVKNGRLSNAAGFFGTMLKLKPLLEVSKEGKVVTVDKIRTTQKARESMLSKFMEEIKGKNVEIFIIYTNNFDEAADLKDRMMENPEIKDIKLVPLTPVVGCHAGPGTMGLGYIEVK